MISVNCSWGEWGAWESCSVTCQGGVKSSTRAIARPAKYGGTSCTGESIREQSCNNNACGVTGKCKFLINICILYEDLS